MEVHFNGNLDDKNNHTEATDEMVYRSSTQPIEYLNQITDQVIFNQKKAGTAAVSFQDQQSSKN